MYPIYLLVLSFFYQFGHAVDSTCRLTSILFRHGNRSPIGGIPSDLHTESDWPQGYAQLTSLGIQQAYDLGHFLRSWYDGFLDQRYIKKEIHVESTDTERTLMSAQAVLASLYVPCGVQAWHPGITWQPIPIHPATWKKLDRHCRKEVVKEAKEQITKTFRAEYKDVFEEIEKGLGVHLSGLGMLWNVYDTLNCEREHNMSWPSWMDDRLLQAMSEILPYHHKTVFSLSPDRGDLLSKMIQDMSGYIHGDTDKDKKAFIYSGHDTNILCLMCSLNAYNLQLTPYSTAVMVELHYGNISKEKPEDREPYDNGDDGDWMQQSAVSLEDTQPTPRSENLYTAINTYEITNSSSITNTTSNENVTSTADINMTSVSTTTPVFDATTVGSVITSEATVADETTIPQPQWFVQIWLRNETTRGPYKVTIPGCTSDCPWERFLELAQPAMDDLHLNITACNARKADPPQYSALWKAMFATVGTGGVVMLGVIVISALCLYQHRKRRQRLQAIYRQLNTEDIPMSDTS